MSLSPELMPRFEWKLQRAQTNSYSSVIFHVTHPWTKGNTTFFTWPLCFTFTRTTVWRNQVITRTFEQRILVIASSSSILLKILHFLFALRSTSVHLFAILNVIARKIYHSQNEKECSKVTNVVSTRHNHHPLFPAVTTWQNPVKKCCLYLYHAMLLANYSCIQEFWYETLPKHHQIQEQTGWTASSCKWRKLVIIVSICQ